jgi:hypothetical protein
MAHTDNGTRTGREIPLLRAFWDSDPDYAPAAMHKNFGNCKLVSNEINLDSVKPEIGCRTVVEKYMSIGSLVMFDEKTYSGLIKLWAMVKEDYALAITNSDSMDINSEKRILAGSSEDTVIFLHPQSLIFFRKPMPIGGQWTDSSSFYGITRNSSKARTCTMMSMSYRSMSWAVHLQA